MTAFLDTDIVVRHLTGDPPDMAARATAFLAQSDELFLVDLVVAEVVYVLESFYEVPRGEVAAVVRALLTLDNVVTLDRALLLRTVEIYQAHRLDFADAYLVASAETSGVSTVASFDKAIDRVGTVRRLAP